jgi:hypothetical protein
MHMLRAFCWANGVIEFQRAEDGLPEGTLPIAFGAETEVRGLMNALARHGFDQGTLLVPGIPEAESDDGKLAALQAFAKLVKDRRALSNQIIHF